MISKIFFPFSGYLSFSQSVTRCTEVFDLDEVQSVFSCCCLSGAISKKPLPNPRS